MHITQHTSSFIIRINVKMEIFLIQLSPNQQQVCPFMFDRSIHIYGGLMLYYKLQKQKIVLFLVMYHASLPFLTK